MKIGIDIDDTIANTWDYLMPIFSKKFDISLDELKKRPPYYDAVKEKVSPTEFLKIIKENENLLLQIPLKENVKEILIKLKEDGNTIIFITARDNNTYSDPYLISKEYLDKHSIPYDKIIVNAYEKGIVCKKEKIDLFIDDSIDNCNDASKYGIEVLIMDAFFNKFDKEFTHMQNWNQIYEYIKNR